MKINSTTPLGENSGWFFQCYNLNVHNDEDITQRLIQKAQQKKSENEIRDKLSYLIEHGFVNEEKNDNKITITKRAAVLTIRISKTAFHPALKLWFWGINWLVEKCKKSSEKRPRISVAEFVISK